MTALGRIVAAVTSSPAPVVILDSCTLLDIVRAPRLNIASDVRVAQLFLTSVRKVPKTLHILIGSPTQTEWNDHIVETENDCAGSVACCNAVASICTHLGAVPAVAHLPVAVLGLPARLRQLSADLLAAAATMSHNAAALCRAIDRVIASQHPAKPGGKGAKDAVILEHAVEATSKLRAAGFTGTCVFVSSNTKDFAAPNSTNLHRLLAPLFTPIHLEYATSLTHTEAILLAAGWVP
jgi:hypothetical protein